MSEQDVREAKQTMRGRVFPWISEFLLQGPPFMPGDYAPEHNVLGVGVAEKITGGRPAGLLSVRIYVREKARTGALLNRHRLPSEIDGVPTDVVEVGEIQAWLRRPGWDPSQVSENRRTRLRPALAGISCGHPLSSVGTLGAIVTGLAEESGHCFILGNCHTLALAGQAQIGDPVLQPGAQDGGQQGRDDIGRLSRFIPLDFSGAPNTVDAALARVDPSDVVTEVCSIGQIAGQGRMERGLEVVKHGRTTGKTRGIVEDVDADIWVSYPGLGAAHFEGASAIRGSGQSFSSGGDSGALVIEEVTRKACGLLFSGSPRVSFVHPIDRVLDLMRVTWPSTEGR